MSSQFVDINADGHKDILAGSFSGTPQIIMGSADGYLPPQPILDRNGDTVLISAFWNKEEEKWDNSDRSGTEGHCTSASLVDWDADGDLDLLLGDYYGGRLYVRLNEGTAKEAKFAVKNAAVVAGGEPVVIGKGLAAPSVVDWDGDGLFDILCGGAKGGVFFYRNSGKKAAPSFDAAVALIDPIKDDSNSFIKRVPAKDGQPTLPGSSFHLEACDYDGDGDLDLLIGARSSWLREQVKVLTEEEKARLAELDKQHKVTMDKLMQLTQQAKTNEERKALVQSEEYQAIVKEYSKVSRERIELRPDPSASGDFVWLFRRN